jgi:hypothetical protein
VAAQVVALRVVLSSTELVSQLIQMLIFDVFTAVTMRNAVFWDVTPCGSC